MAFMKLFSQETKFKNPGITVGQSEHKTIEETNEL